MGATELKGSKMKFGSLFAGIGGLDLGLERAGMECRWQVEIDDYCNKILSKHWPNVPKYRDVREVGKENLEAVDLICGGFPCQDISIAGKGIGIEGERSGLWKEFARIIGELRPRYALIENVPMLSRRGLNVVLADLAEKGYDAEWCDIRASDLGAYHKRERLFIVAYSNVPGGGASPNGGDLDRAEEDKGRQELTLPVLGGFCLDVADTKSTVRGGGRLYGTTPKRNVSEPSHEEQSMVWREADGCCGVLREEDVSNTMCGGCSIISSKPNNAKKNSITGEGYNTKITKRIPLS